MVTVRQDHTVSDKTTSLQQMYLLWNTNSPYEGRTGALSRAFSKALLAAARAASYQATMLSEMESQCAKVMPCYFVDRTFSFQDTLSLLQ